MKNKKESLKRIGAYPMYVTIRVSDSAAVIRCFTRYFVPKMRSPASPNPGKMYPFSLSWRSRVET